MDSWKECCLFAVAGLVSLLQHLISSSPNKTSRKFDWSGQHTGFRLTAAAAEPCKTPTTPQTLNPTAAAEPLSAVSASSAPSGELCLLQGIVRQLKSASSSSGKPPTLAPAAAEAAAKEAVESNRYAAAFGSAAYALWLQQANLAAPSSLLAAALQLLLAYLHGRGRQAAAQLYACNVSDVLERLCGFCTPEVLALTEKVYSQMCVLSSQLRDEVMQDGNMTALTGIVKAAAAAAAAVATAQASAATTTIEVAGSPAVTETATAAARLAEAQRASSLADVDGLADAAVLIVEPTTAATAAATAAMPVNVTRFPVKLLLAALSRLVAAVDAAPGADIINFTGAAVKPSLSNAAGAAAAAANRPGVARTSSSASTAAAAGVAAAGAAVDVMRHIAEVIDDGSSCGLAAVVVLMVRQQSLLLQEAAGQVGFLYHLACTAMHCCWP
jgi:hypothetical protein